MAEKIAAAINQLAQFCGPKDLPALTQTALQQTYGYTQADVFVLFGGSILAGGDLLAQAIQAKVAKKYIIVGGAGHTTPRLRQQMAPYLPNQSLEQLSEAELFSAYLQQKYQLTVDYLETKSTNCGNNITYLLALLAQQQLPHQTMILAQDASMQRRMAAGLHKYAPEVQIINYATYQVQVQTKADQLVFDQIPLGLWSMSEYITLLLGEIPRLRNDPNGYGPKGQNFIAPVSVPAAVQTAFETLAAEFPDRIRQANSAYASDSN